MWRSIAGEWESSVVFIFKVSATHSLTTDGLKKQNGGLELMRLVEAQNTKAASYSGNEDGKPAIGNQHSARRHVWLKGMHSSLAWLKIADPFSIMAILAFVAILAIRNEAALSIEHSALSPPTCLAEGMYSSLAWLKIADPFSIMAILAFVAILAIRNEAALSILVFSTQPANMSG
jgi:hypothetical protein